MHLAAAGIKPITHPEPAPSQGCVPLQQLPPGCIITTFTQPGPDAAAAAAKHGDWGHQWAEAATYDDEHQWPGPEAVVEELPKQDFFQALQQLSQASLVSQPRLLTAISLYQMYFSRVCHMQLVDTQMGELQRPVQLGAFLALQRLHLENMAELLQTEWAMKVGLVLADQQLRLYTAL